MASHHPAAATPRPVFPGDLIQITAKEHPLYMAILMVETVRANFTAAHIGCPALSGGVDWDYHRVRADQYAVVGTAALVSAETAAARKAAVETQRLIDAEQAPKS